ncbi:MAG: glycosyltransferase [Clostridioides sp.]|nr:glycosyltransferase [Clostridioides sp.]
MEKSDKILIASPIHQTPEILSEFLLSLTELKKDNFEIHYYFIDDNIDVESSNLLETFKGFQENVTIVNSNISSRYVKTESTHLWNNALIDKITQFKNSIIKYAGKNDFDYLFFIDSDVLVAPLSLIQLRRDDKDIVSNIFWTRWGPNSEPMPQVWVQDKYNMYDGMKSLDYNLQSKEFLNKLRTPGVYKVGGLGACTLLSKKAINSGISFDRVYNVSFWGEDRHFCIRAAVLGFDLFVDTHYPAYHIYRDSDLNGVAEFKSDFKIREDDLFNSEFKRLISEFKQLISESILPLENYSYKDLNGIQIDDYLQTLKTSAFINNFTPKEFERQLNMFKSQFEEIISEKLIRKSEISAFDLSTDDTGILSCSFEISAKGFKRSYGDKLESFTEINPARCELIKDKNGCYSISKYEKFDKKPIFNPPMTRYIRESPKLTLSMVVKNEAGRYLRMGLESIREYIDEAVIIDDGSVDDTIAICEEILTGIPLKIIKNEKSQFHNEANLRKQQWIETIKTDPEWMIFLDSDEIFEDSFKRYIHDLMINEYFDCYTFRLYDFWDENHYRDDALWCAHKIYRPFLVRYQKEFKYAFKNTPQHCGRLPYNVNKLLSCTSSLRLKHYGWARECDRIEKYNRYMRLDPQGIYGSMAQYESILDEYVNLVEWIN